MNRGPALVLAALLAAGAWLGGCRPGTDSSALLELRRGNGSEPDSIDPQLARMEAAMTILRDCYEGLVSMGPGGEAIAGAAATWNASEDGRRYTFKLRPSARWSNGDALVAEDFAAAFRRLVDPATASQYALMLEPVANAIDIVARRNAHYWNDAANRIDAVRYVHVADPVTELTRFRAGDLDITYTVPPGEVARLEKERPGQLRIAPQAGVYCYGFALDLPPFRGAPDLRRAVAMAIDREVLAKQVLGDGERPAFGWVPDGVAGYEPQRFDWASLDATERIAEARRLYAKAGYSAAKPLKVELRSSKSPLHDRIALAVTAMWKEQLGVEVSLRSEDFRVLKAAIDAREAPLFRGSWIGDYNDPYSFLQVLKGGFGINLPRYANAAYDSALDSAAVATGAERAARLAAAERALLVDVPLIPLYFYVSKHLVSPRVEGFYANVMNVTYSKDLSLAGAKEQEP
ncbi:MAG: peptide ABC transporter substrate-binding protein [Steroidobacteraceae bacterium]